MTTLAIVVTLVGQAWAENANGERRALEVGDQLAVDETLIMAEGARIDLDFGDNQQLTFLGEQQVTPEVRGDLIEQTESLSSLETNDLPEPVTPIESDRGGLSEGHSFVQLVRIGEIIEADGYTPVTVARIQEVLRPFGMSIPQQEFVRGSERDGTRYDEQSYPETGLKLAKLSISIDAITGDDIVDATEAGQPVTLTGTVGGGVSPGDTVAVTVNGQLYNTTVNADGRTWQVDVPGSELAKDNKVQATVNSVEPNGTPVSESAERPYWADDITPSVSVELEQGSGPNGEFNESDTNDGKVEGRITFGPNSKPGDTITVTDKDGNPILDGKGDPITDYEITQGDIDNGITVEVPVTPGQTDVELKVDITDSVGNTSSASDNKAVDNVGPQLRVEIEGEGSIAHYDAAKITNGQAKVTVKLIAGAVEAGDQLIVRDGNGNTVINRPVTDAEVASGEVDVLLSVAQGQTVVNVEAVITDPAGNSSNDTDGKVILSPDLAIDTAQIDDAAGTIDISGSTSDVAPGSDVVITITDKDGNTVSVTAQTNASGDYTITGQDISGLTDGPLDIKAETTDHNGKTVDDSVADAIDHIAGGLSVDTTTVASTGPTVDISGSSTDVHPGETVTVTITDQDGTTVTTSAIVQADGTYTVIGTDISSLVDGPLTIDASATDNNGNPVSGSDTAELDSLAGSMTVAFTNDPIADPALAEVTGTTADVAPGETVSLTFTDVNNQTTTATAVVASDGTYTTTVDLRGLTDGDITVDAAATDRNGDPVNATNNAELDAIVADIAIKGTSVDDVSGTIDISGSTTDVAPNTTVNVTITDKDNNTVTTIATTDANGDYVVNGTDISGLTDGDLTITAETTDHNGNPINATATDALDYVASALVVDTTTVDDASQTVDISGSTTDVHPGETVTVVITDQDGTTVTTSATVQADGTYTVTGEDISSLVDGPLTIDASATDNNGNPVSGSDTDDLNNLPGSMTVAFTNDPIADPALAEVTGTTVDVAPGETVSLTFTDVNNQTTTATAVVASDGTYTSTVDLRGLTDGTITVDATATDRNSDPVTGTDTAELDAVAAAIVIDATNVDDAAGTIDISGSTTDVAPGSDVDITITDKDNNTVTVTVQTDGTGNYTVTGENISGLTDGPLDIKAETTDHNGNLIDDTATDALDYVSGDLAVDTTTVDDANQTVDISGSTTDVHAGETVTITIKDQDGNTVTTSAIVQPDGTYTVTGTDISSLVDGPLDITAEATDNNGNPVSGSDTAELDNLTGSMTVTFTNDPIADPALAEVTGTTADVAPGETVSLTFTDVNNQTTTATAVVASDGTYTTTVDLRGLTDGDITVDAAATDRNSDPVNATNNAELDAIVADIAIDSTSVDDAAGTIDISGSTTDVAPGELVTVTITDKDGGSVTAVGPVEVQADGTYSVSGTDISGLTDGALTITAETTDHNNNPINATATDALDYVAGALVVDTTTVDDANQTVDISGSTTDVHPGETVTVAITDQDGTTVTTSAIVQPDGTYTVTGEDISSLVDGPLTIDASATDNNGNPVSGSDTAELDNLTGSMTVAFTNDPIADPSAAEVTGTTVDVAPGETVSLTFTDVNGQTRTTTAIVDASGNYTATIDLRGLTDGDMTVDAAATDRNSDPVNATNNAELDAIVADIAIDSTSVDDAAGTIDISGSTTDVAPGELVTVTITDKDGGSVTAVGPVEVQADGTYSVSGTDISGLTDGALTITAETTDHNNNPINATATDALDYVAGALVVDTTTVDDANQTVDISGSTTDVHPGETVTVAITDQDGTTVTTSAIVQPDGTYTVTGEDISSLVDGPLTIDASATDNNGNPVSGSDTAELDNLTGSMTVAFTNDPIADPSAAEVTGTTVDVAPGETVSLTFTDVNGQTRTTTAIVDASGNYTATIDLRGLTDGDMTVDAAATDRNSDPVNATNNAELDAIVADIAIDSTSVDDAAGTIDISGSTTDVAPGELVTVTITDKDGGSVTAVGPVEVQADGTYSVSGTDISGLTDGALTITAETTDHNNNPINATATDALDYVAGALVVDTTTVDDANQTVDISGSTTDVHPGETVTVAITDQDGTTVTTSAIVQPDGTYTVTGEDISSLVDGPLTIDASATDNNGNPVSGSDTAELDNLTGSMTVAFTNDPIADPSAAEVTGTTVDVAPGETVSLTFTDVNGQTRTTTAIVDASGNYTATIDLRGLTDGDMTVDAAATDRNSDPVNATNNAELDAIVADIAIDSTSVDDAAGTIDIAGSTTDVAPNTQVNITITDKDGGVVTTTATTDANGDYVVTGTDISGLIDGDVTITANTVDHNNNTITDSATDTLDNDLSGLTVDTVTVDNASQLIDISGNTTDVFPGETVTITIKDQDGTEVTTTTTVNPDGSYDVSGTDISSLVDGPLTIDASATDNNGNPVSGSDTAELDNLTGSMTVAFTNDPIADPSAAEVTGTTVDVAPGETVSLTFTDVNGQTRTTTAIVDASGNYTATIDLRGLTDGDMTVDAAATDRNSDPVNATNNAELDAIVADIAIDSTSVDDAAGTIDIAGSTTDVAPNTQVNITITDKDGGVVTTTATTDANGDYVVTGTDISGLIDGDVTITANTVDHNNNTITDSATDTLDNDLSGLTVDTVTVDNASQLIDISGNTTDVFPGETVTITIKDQDGTEVTTTTTVNPDGSYDVSGTDISSLVDGPLEITAESTDNNGEPVSGTGNDELDNIGDTITVTLDDITSTNESAVTVSGTTADVLPGETVDLTFSDGTNITTATATVAQDGSYVTVVDLSSLGDGLISVDAEVDGRNQTVNASDNATKDVLAPSLTITSADSTLADTETTEITFTFSEAVTGFDATDITVAGGTLTNLATTDNIIWTADFEADGSGNITVEVANNSYTDVVGNLGSGNNHTINTAPTASDITLAAEDAENFVYEASGLFTDADGDNLSYSASNLPAGLTINTSTGLITGTLGNSASQTNGGTYTIEVTVSDGEGGTNTADITLTVTNPAPVTIASIEDKTFDDSDTVSIQTSQAFNDPDGDTITYSASNLPSGLTIDANTGVITGTLASSASQGGTGGDYSVTVTANDGEGGSVDTSFTISINNPAPVVDPVQGVTADDGEYVEIQTQFSDPDSDALSYTILSGAPAGFTIDSSGKISGTLASNASQLGPDSDGYYHIIVQATDADGATVTDTIELLAKNPGPVVDTPLTNASADDGGTFTLDTSAAFNDPDGDTLSYSATGLPGGLSIDTATGEITGTLSSNASQHGVAGDGKYTIEVTVNDGQGGTASSSFELQVNNTAPEAVNDAQSTDEDAVLNVNAAGGVLSNDTDTNNDTLTVTNVSDGTNNVSPGQAIAGSNGGIFRVYADGSYDFDPNGEFDSLAAGENQQSSVTYTVSDGKGGTDTAELNITINGVNNPPVAEDDQAISDASGVTIDVLSNDSDVDASDTLTITEIDGNPISVGSPVTTTEGVVTLNADGTLTFVPDSGFTGNQANFDYTISDGTATATATVTVDVIRVNITDDNSIDASLAQQNTPDGTLADIDDLANTQITGSIPQGGSVVSLVVSDGTTTINVDPNTIAIFPNGSFTTTVDTTGLDDGNISVTLEAQNSQGATATSDDSILKDTVTQVEIDPLDVVNGEVPVVTGTGEPEATIIISVDDGTGKTKVGEAIVDGSGNWTFTPTNAIDPTFKVIADATDKWGNTEDVHGNPASDSRDIPSLDTGATVEVDEAGLAIGSDAGNKPIEVSSSFTLGGNDDLQHLVVDGTTVTKAALENLGATPVTITQGHYTIELTGYNSGTGEVNYTYTLTDPVAHDAPPSGTDSDTNVKEELITVVVVDVNNDTRTGQITVEITDDVPATPVDDTAVTVEEGAVAVGSANTGNNLLANDVLGADGGQVHDISYTDRSGVTQTNVGVPAAGLTVDTQYGELTVNQDGSWSYTPVDSADHVQPGNDVNLSDDFSYRVIDNDGDISSSSATQAITVTDTVPVVGTANNASVDEASLTAGSTPNNGALTQTGSLAVTKAADDIDTQFVSTTVADFVALGLTSGGTAISYLLSGDGHTLTASAGANTIFTATITNPTANAGYQFVLAGAIDHVQADGNDANLNLPFNFIVTDSDNDTATGSFNVTVVDDVPVAADDSNTVAEASYAAVTGNVISTGAGADNQGADGATVTDVTFGGTSISPPSDNSISTINGTYGVLTIQADGSYSYQRNAGTAGGVNDEFSYTLTDGDGDTASATLTVTISDAPVAITNLTPQASGGDATVLESKLTGGTNVGTGDANATGSFTISSADGIAELSITHDGNTYNLVLSNTAQVLPTITTALGNTLEITGYDAGTGVVSYTYTLASEEAHSAQGQDDLFENFTINLEDMDGDSTTGDLAVRIVDDIPLITQNITNTAAVEVDESNFANSTENFSGLFSISHGADGTAITDATVYTLDANTISGLVDTASGAPVTLSANANGTVVTGTADGNTVFTIAIDSATGDITLDQSRAVRHSDTSNHNDSVAIDTAAVSIVATATDGDGDEVTSTIAIGDRFTFLDDGPSITVNATQVGAIELDETNLTGASHSTTNANFAAGVFTTDFGADGAASTAGFVYSLTVSGNAVSSGLTDTASGEDVLLRVNGSGEVEGYTAGGNQIVFTVSVDSATGALTLEQVRTLSHPDTTNHDDVVSILDSTIQLVGTATDGDGDTAEQSINIGGQITFRDDGPSITAVTAETTVDEKGLQAGSAPDGNLLTASASLNVDFGGDGAGDVQFTAATVTALEGLSLKAGGTGLEFVIDNDNHSLTAYRGAGRAATDKVFTVEITNPTSAPSYDFELQTPIDHGGAADLTLAFQGIQVTDGDGDSVTKGFNVKVVDDVSQSAMTQTVDEDSSVTFNTSADANPTNTTIYDQADNALARTGNGSGGFDYASDYGTVTVNADGTITYAPNANYSGEEVFVFKTQDGGSTEDTTVTMTITPIADAPNLEADKTITTDEDVSIALGLQMPIITDATDQNGTAAGDDPERLGEITLSLTGTAIGTLTNAAGDTTYTDDGNGNYTFVIVDGIGNVDDNLHHNGITTGQAGVNYVTQTEYEAIKALPAADRHENFGVEVSVSSYEVDASGAALPDAEVGGANGAQSTQTITVDVLAVTDVVNLEVQQGAAQPDVTVAISGGDKVADVTLNEDNSFNLTSILNPDAFVDTDGSETRYLGIHGLPDGTTITVGGSSFVIGTSPIATFDFGDGNGAVPAIEIAGTQTTLPVITITPQGDFSGDINSLTVTLAARDSDSDSTVTPSLVTNAVTVNLHVNPVAGDVGLAANDVTTPEDTAVAFMENIEVTDTIVDGGTERITQVEFSLPTGWVLTDKPTGGEGSDWEITGSDALGYTITALASGYDLQTVLKDFTITPAPHSSVDETITVAVTSEDKNMVDGAEVISPTVTTNLDINVEVTAVAEELGPDLTMSGDYNYVTNAVEDVWFDLHQGSVLSGWENQDQDGSEETFALFTPALSDGINPVSANGSEFRYSTDGGATFVSQTYNGTAIEVPIAYLDTLQYKAPQDFAGNFEIQVTAKTVDTDPDTSDQSIWTGGSATLSGIVDPVADEVNLAVSGRARGDEDTDIPLNIRVSTSDIDASETITLTLSDIPAGAQLMYDGAALTLVDDGKGNGTFAVTIEEFDPSKPMTVRPPEHSNENFSIGLSAVSVDESGGVIDTSAAKTGQVEVIVRGVADDASLTVANPVFTEADVDTTEPSVAIDGFGGVNLNQVITGTTLVDTDGSEKLTIKISGLEPEFHLVGGNFLGGTGTDRVWVLTQDQLANAKVLLPINFSGTVTANAVPITTENDGNAKSSPSVPLSFTVTPSIDETIKPSTSNLQEDSLHQVDFSLLAPSNDRIVDTDEELTAIWIAAADADTSDYTLYFGNAGKTLAQAVTDGDPGIVLDGSEYKITGAAISNVYAQGAPNAHGNFTFDVGYEITDPSTDGTLPATSERTNSTHTLEIEAVTDPATLVINSITADTASTTITGTTGVEAVENTALTVNVTLSKDPDANGNNERDYDGSETITKVFVDGVPAGVTIDGAVYIGNIPGSGNTGRWLLSGQPTGKSMTADETFDLVIGLTGSAANLSSLNQELSIRVATQDAGNSAEHVTSDSFTLTTPATFDDTNSETDQPAVIVNWADEPTFVATEDTSFKLSDALVGEITGSSDFAITITGLPAGTVVSGMTMTDSDGNPNGFNTWTVSGAGSDADLQALLRSIEVNLPEHWNSNAYAGAEFEFDTTLTTYAGVGDRNAADARVSQVVTPVTDAAVITISNAETVNEDATVEFTVAIDNPADSAGNASNLVDGKLYLQITETDMAGGTLSYGGMSLALQNIVGVEGVADGQYYVADLGDGVGMGHGTSVVVSYQPPLHQSGTVSLEAWAPTKETDAANTVASVTSVDSNGEVAVVPVNDGFDIQAANVSGDEDSLIELAISGAGLIDNDGSEEVKSVLLTGLPDDFLVYVSNNADGSGAVLADNAGANGWAIPTVAGQLPPYVAVQPPLHWNGTASVGITALTGEKALLDVESSTTSFDIEVVPVADGLDIAPLNTSGTEGDIIAIDINPSLVDLNEAVNLQIEGLGEYAAFHLNGNLMTTGVSYDELTDTYTLNGLTEAELGQLGFVQSAGTYTVDVSAQTVDGTDVSTPVVTDSFIATINPVAPTAGDDTLLYGGLPIDAGAGDDTIQLRFGEDVTASDLASNLDNVEVLDLGVVGENAIGDDVAGLSIQDVLDITDSRNALKIDGDSYDSVFLKNSEWTTNNTGPGGYVTYTSTDTSATLNISDQITSITMVD